MTPDDPAAHPMCSTGSINVGPRRWTVQKWIIRHHSRVSNMIPGDPWHIHCALHDRSMSGAPRWARIISMKKHHPSISGMIRGDPAAYPLRSTGSINVWTRKCSQTILRTEHRSTVTNMNPTNSIARPVSLTQPIDSNSTHMNTRKMNDNY